VSARLQLQPLDRANPAQLAGLWAVWQAAYGQEARLLGLAPADFPPLARDLDSLRHDPAPAMGATAAGQWLGVLVYQPGADGTEVTIDALLVAPAWQRRGIGSALLIGLMRAHPQARLQVSTARANAPALALYQRLGFEAGPHWEVAQGLVLLRLTRRAFAEQPC
jgi:ribosomal protein S18 acetylase RimI-like enzyme